MKETFFSILLIQVSIFSQTTWTEINVLGNSTNHCIYFTDSLTGYITNEAGNIIKTTNSGQNWFIQTTAPSRLTSICFLNTNTGYAVGNTTCMRTTNAGLNWVQFSIPVGTSYNKVIFTDNNTGFIMSVNGQILKTNNSGLNWSQVFSNGVSLSDIFFVNEYSGFACMYSGLYKTTNQGTNWATVPSNTNRFDRIFFLNETTGYMAGDYTPGPPPSTAPAVLVYSTYDSGLTWSNISPPLGYISCSMPRSLYFLDEYIGYLGNVRVCGNTNIFYKTVDRGATWFTQLPNSVSSITSIFFINSNTGFITGSHTFKTTNGGSNLTSINIESEMFSEYSLSQNYPNPFNPVTNIKFDIPNRSYVKISVYDILGKEISILVNEELNPGTFEVNWDASNFPSGVYFYKIETDEFSESKKMVLVK